MLKKFSNFLPLLLVVLVLASCGSSRFSARQYRNREYVKVDPIEVAEKKAEERKYPVTGSQVVGSQEEETLAQQNVPQVAEISVEEGATISPKQPAIKEQKGEEKRRGESKSLNTEKNTARKIQAKIEKVVSLPSSEGTTADQILLIILAILLPPLAVYLKDGSATTLFWITLILCLLGGGFFFGWGGYFGGAWFIAFLLALLRVLDVI